MFHAMGNASVGGWKPGFFRRRYQADSTAGLLAIPPTAAAAKAPPAVLASVKGRIRVLSAGGAALPAMSVHTPNFTPPHGALKRMMDQVTETQSATRTPDGRPRTRGLGIELAGIPGPLNALTDVGGVEIGVTTLIEGDGPLVVGQGPVRTGVTAILPRGRTGVGQLCAAGWFSLNGNGEMTGTTWIDEAGSFTLPVVLSNTHAVGACHTGVVRWANRVAPRLARQWLLPVCAETWDGYLNDINGDHVRPEHVEAALDGATGGPVAEGSVGG